MINRKVTIVLITACCLAAYSTARGADAKRSGAKFIAVLKSSNASLKSRHDACRELATIGDPKAIPVLVGLLGDADMSQMARYALEPIKDASVDAAFRQAMGKLTGDLQVGVINSIGVRRDGKAADALAKLVKTPDKSVASAAVAALGRIATPKAIDALAACRKAPPEGLKLAVADASLAAAERLAAKGKPAEAIAIYAELNDKSWPAQVRLGAFAALLDAQADKAPARIAAALSDGDSITRSIAIAKIATLKGDGVSKRFAEMLPKLPAGEQAILINALAARKDPAARPAIVKAVASDNTAVRIAATKALGSLGDTACAELLCGIVTDAKTAPEKLAAQSSLRALNVKGVDDILIKRLKTAQGDTRIDLINILVDRKATAATNSLIFHASAKDLTVSAAALKGLGRIAPPEKLPSVLRMLRRIEGQAPRREAELAAVAISRRIAKPENQADAVLTALKTAKSTPLKRSLLAILGGIGNAKAFDAVKTAADDETFEIKDAAVRALVAWPNKTATEAVLNIFATTRNHTHRTLALRGAVRLLSMPEQNAEKALEAYKMLLGKLKRPADIKLVLSGLGNLKDRRALEIIKPFLSMRAVQREATAAIQKISKTLTVRKDDIIYTKLIKAVYGSEQNTVDVTGKLTAQDDGSGTISISGEYNELFGDPAERQFKNMVITFELKGKQQTVTLHENTPFTLKPLVAKKPSGTFTPLFDGKTLSGWKGEKSLWKVEDGAICGQTSADAPLKHNSFLHTEKEYGDFELTLKYRLGNHNSGVQVRSQVRENFRVTGYQADIAEKKYTGILYEEGGRGIIAKVKPAAISKFIKKNDWNNYRIVCRGAQIRFWINGQPTITYTEKKPSAPKKGVIAFQLHQGPPMKVFFKDIKIKELR